MSLHWGNQTFAERGRNPFVAILILSSPVVNTPAKPSICHEVIRFDTYPCNFPNFESFSFVRPRTKPGEIWSPSDRASMAGIKRKQSASSGIPQDDVKKRKQGGDRAVESSASSNPEAETDSDPMIESDTTEHSGDDDGVSWPSDDEHIQEENGEETGLPDKSHANGHKSTAPAAITNGVSSRSSK